MGTTSLFDCAGAYVLFFFLFFFVSSGAGLSATGSARPAVKRTLSHFLSDDLQSGAGSCVELTDQTRTEKARAPTVVDNATGDRTLLVGKSVWMFGHHKRGGGCDWCVDISIHSV